MSRASMAEAASTLPRAPIYGIGRIRVGEDHRDFEVGWADFERDTDWAESVLRSAGLASGDVVLVTGQNSEGPWINPVLHALRRIGAVYLPAEVWSFDANRTSMFLQRLPVKAIIGLTGETLAGLQNQDPPVAELLRNVEMVWARPDAVGRLSEVAPEVLPFVALGPALALGIPGQPGAVVNAPEWTVDTENGELLVSNARERAATFDRTPTAIRGSVLSVADGAITINLEKEGTA